MYVNINSRPREGHWSATMLDVNTPVWNTCMRHVRAAHSPHSLASLSSFLSPSPFSRFLSLLHPTLRMSILSESRPRVAVGTWFRACQAWKMSQYFSPDRKKYRKRWSFFATCIRKNFLFYPRDICAHRFLSDIYRLRATICNGWNENKTHNITRRLLPPFHVIKNGKNICWYKYCLLWLLVS